MGRARDIANATTSSLADAVVKRDGTGAIVGLPSTNVQTFSTAGSATWTKPSTGTMALIEVWGAGGGGGATTTGSPAAGGGGGAYVSRVMRLSDLTGTVAVTVGAGGASRAIAAAGNIGGNSSFGAYVTAYGGIGGSITLNEYSLGGTAFRAGSRIANTALTVTDYPDQFDQATAGGLSVTTATDLPNLKVSVNGGGAGASTNGSNTYAEGASLFGGSGGALGVAGTQPGGGGGRGNTSTSTASGKGGDGQVRVTVW